MSEQNRLLRSQQVSPEDDFAYGQGISPEATWRNLIPFAEFGLGMAPVSGEAMAARDAWDASGRGGNALLRGDYGQAASDYLNMGTGLLGAIPGAGIIARGTKRGAAWMDRNLPEGFNRLLDSVYPSDPRSTTNIFAGPTAKTADHAALAKAQEMKAQGASRADIWRETGWDLEKGDQVPRFEIDDSNVAVNIPKNKWSGEYGYYKSSIDHPDLYEAYPPMQRNRVTFDHREDDSSIFLEKPSPNVIDRKQYDTDIGIKGRTLMGDRSKQTKPNAIRGSTVHELQHNVQGREGFAVGSGPEEIWQAALDAGNPITPEEAIDIYRRLAGEVEARNVTTRLNMSPAERRATPPWETQDVPDDQQIVRFGNQGPAYSIPDGPTTKRRISGPSDSPERPRKSTEHLVYHGTPTELAGGKFDPDRIRSHGGGFYFTDNPSVAEFYSKQPNISSGKSAPQVIPAYVDTEGFLVKDYGGASYKEMVRDAAEVKKSGKYKGIIGKNVKDAAQVDEVGITYIPQTQYLTWTPNTVRSSKTGNQLYNASPYLAAPLLGYGLYGGSDDEQ